MHGSWPLMMGRCDVSKTTMPSIICTAMATLYLVLGIKFGDQAMLIISNIFIAATIVIQALSK